MSLSSIVMFPATGAVEVNLSAYLAHDMSWTKYPHKVRDQELSRMTTLATYIQLILTRFAPH